MKIDRKTNRQINQKTDRQKDRLIKIKIGRKTVQTDCMIDRKTVQTDCMIGRKTVQTECMIGRKTVQTDCMIARKIDRQQTFNKSQPVSENMTYLKIRKYCLKKQILKKIDYL